MHPALGGGFGPKFKVSKGYDFAGDKYNGDTNNVITPDKNPFANAVCGGHGTHVAGIIAANSTGSDGGPVFTGVVPKAKIGAYKVFGCTDPDTGNSFTDDELVSLMSFLMAERNETD